VTDYGLMTEVIFLVVARIFLFSSISCHINSTRLSDQQVLGSISPRANWPACESYPLFSLDVKLRMCGV